MRRTWVPRGGRRDRGLPTDDGEGSGGTPSLRGANNRKTFHWFSVFVVRGLILRCMNAQSDACASFSLYVLGLG